MNYLDLFSGIGGFSLGLQQAGFKFNNHFYSEIDKYAEQVYRKQFPEAEGLGSVTDIEIRTTEQISRRPDLQQSGVMPHSGSSRWKQQQGKRSDKPRNTKEKEFTTEIRSTGGTFQFFGKINLITFGFPCQDLSIAGKRTGLGGSRSGLFFEAMRIIRACRPRHFVFENVKGLFSSNNGEDWFTVLREVADSGYDGQWQLLNTRGFLPQNRERIYFVGHIRGECRPQIFPIGEGCNGNTGTQGEAQNLKQIGQIGKDSEATRVYSPDGIARTIKNGGGQGAKTGLYRVGNKNPSGKGQSGNIYDPSGIFPSIMAGGGNPNRKRDIGYSMGNIWLDNNQRTMLEVAPTINKIGNLKGKGGHECHNVHDPKGIAPTVRENHGKITLIEQDIHGVELKAKPMQWRRSEKGRKARKEAMEKGKDITPFSDGHRELVESDKNEIGCITNALNKDALLSQQSQIRRLTPIECERLQGFPDGWTKYGVDTIGRKVVISDTQRYKLLGNSVTTNVVKAIGERLCNETANT